MIQHNSQRLQSILWVLLLCTAGCGITRNPVPVELADKAQIPGIPKARALAGLPSPAFQQTFIESIQQEGDAFKTGPNGERSYDFLALSGGGDNGAYGAGLLCGWSKAGTRPKFKFVTGISTGALVSTFAFLGEEYDDQLKKAFTTTSTADIMQGRSILVWPYSDAISDSAPLARMIARYHPQEMLEAVAREHKKGRRLFIGTTNLDADRFVIWDMGAIAASGHPDSMKLYHSIIRASAAIPIVFPPVYIPVEADGKRYDEMHVDGGVKAQVFLGGILLDIAEVVQATGLDMARMKRRVFIIRNGKMRLGASRLKPKIGVIAGKTVSSMINFNAVGDLYRIYLVAAPRGTEFNLAFIPDDYEGKAKEAFDPVEMTRLFNTAYEQAKAGYSWQKRPPGISDEICERLTK